MVFHDGEIHGEIHGQMIGTGPRILEALVLEMELSSHVIDFPGFFSAMWLDIGDPGAPALLALL